MNWPLMNNSRVRRRALGLLLILLVALAVRGLTAQFVGAHLTDAGWFQYGSYAIFDRQAQDVLDGRESFFWIPDNTRTDLIQYPPGYRVWVALVYWASGERSALAVQRVQWVMDAFAVLLIVGIGVTAFGWRVGFTAGVLAALFPVLALPGASPTADAPTMWVMLAGVWLMLIAAKRRSIAWAVGAGAMLGFACWLRVNPLLLIFGWGAALLLFTNASWRVAARLGAALMLTATLVIAPVIVRNLIVFYPEFAPTGLNVGWNLWAGIGETERAAEFDAPCCDMVVIEQERKAMGLAPDAPLGLVWPDGIRRDRERGRKALAVIRAHPLWYMKVMAERAWGLMKFAGEPSSRYGSAGINVTSKKCLPPAWQGGALAFGVRLLGMAQSVLRFIILPLMLLGIWLGWRKERRMTALLMTTVLYYFFTLIPAHAELRYALPMYGVLVIFAGVAVTSGFDLIRRRREDS